jgi:uncharacterized protein (TIGR02118 family)
MVRFLVLYNTPEDPAEFDRYYREVHIPLAKRLPGLSRYTISRDVGLIRGPETYYMIAELDFADRAGLEDAFASPEGQAAAQDVPKFATGGAHSMVYDLEDV